MKLNEFEKLTNFWTDTSWSDTIYGKEFTLNITELLNHPEVRLTQTEKIKTKTIKHLLINSVENNLKRVNQANLQYPIIITTVDGQYNQILDGHHRLKKAILNNIPTINAKVIEITLLPLEWQTLFARI